MKLKDYIQILILGLVIIGTTLDAVYVGSDFSIETKIDFEKDNESSEKEKKDSKYLEFFVKTDFVFYEKLVKLFSTQLIIGHSHVDEELIPPEV
jgi:hypothetical protein